MTAVRSLRIAVIGAGHMGRLHASKLAALRDAGPSATLAGVADLDAARAEAVAREFGGGGHTNASGCSARGEFADLKMLFEGKLSQAIAAAAQNPSS